MIQKFLPFVLVLACAKPAPSPPDVRGTAPRTTAPVIEPAEPSETAARTVVDAPAEQESSAPEIEIDRVIAANPLVIQGRARTFENSVVLRVRDAKGTLLAEGYTTSRGEAGQRNPFDGELWLTRDPGGQVTAEALEYSAKDGSERSLVKSVMRFDVPAVVRTLRFPDQSCERTIPFERRMPSSVAAARLLIEALIAGPSPAEKAKGAVGPFPTSAAVRSVNLRDGTLTVDFNETLRNVGGSCRARAIRAAVTDTLRGLPSVERVVITAAGSEPLALQP